MFVQRSTGGGSKLFGVARPLNANGSIPPIGVKVVLYGRSARFWNVDEYKTVSRIYDRHGAGSLFGPRFADRSARHGRKRSDGLHGCVVVVPLVSVFELGQGKYGAGSRLPTIGRENRTPGLISRIPLNLSSVRRGEG